MPVRVKDTPLSIHFSKQLHKIIACKRFTKNVQTSKQVQGLEMRPRLLSPMALLSAVLSKF